VSIPNPLCAITQYRLTKSDGTSLDAADLVRLDGSNYVNDGNVKFQTDLDPPTTVSLSQSFYITAVPADGVYGSETFGRST